jgi:hypothetical protein
MAETLTELLDLAAGPADSLVEYVIGGTTLTPDAWELAAQMLADDAMEVRCGSSPTLERWRAVRDGLTPEDTVSAATVKTYATIGFGPPEDPYDDDHLQGLVAELFWNRLLDERKQGSGGRELVKRHRVKPDPLEPGGDGLVLYKVADTLVFRLWEIKKHNRPNDPVTSVVNTASNQLAARGNEYIAKFAGPDTIEQAGAIGAFYAEMVELWLDGSDRAGVGVSVGTSDKYAPTQATSFKSIAEKFPQFAHAGQTESVVVAVPDFPAFAIRVREIVWSGL